VFQVSQHVSTHSRCSRSYSYEAINMNVSHQIRQTLASWLGSVIPRIRWLDPASTVRHYSAELGGLLWVSSAQDPH